MKSPGSADLGQAPDRREVRKGLLFALAAFGFWGLVPIYFKALRGVNPFEILANRVVWSVPLIAVLIVWGGDWPAVGRALRSNKTLAMLLLSASLVATNWFGFIFGIVTERILETSLGYYINPLVNVMLGVVFLRERLTWPQGVAVGLAAVGTGWLTLSYGAVPWIAFLVAFTFGFYGLLRKTVAIESMEGLFVETSLLFPLAAVYLIDLAAAGGGSLVRGGGWITFLLLCAGVATALPLIWFASAARRLRYSTLGLCQYLAPSMSFLLAVFLYREPFTRAHAVAFGCIWTALAVFSADSVSRQRRG